jgi:succinyl-CoA synthetase beta subunit
MKIHEYQAKRLFREYAIAVPEGQVAATPAEAVAIGASLGFPCVVKAQVHAGGRGKAGGIKLAKNQPELETIAASMIGMRLINNQTGAEGKLVRHVLVEQGLTIKRELYLAILIDRERECPVLIASSAGGMEIEETAHQHPEQIERMHVSPVTGLMDCHIRQLGFKLQLNPAQMKSFAALLSGMFRLFQAYDVSLIEINPLVITADDAMLALDAKVNFDDNALYRHPAIGSLRDLTEEDPMEVEASKFNLNYIKLDGTIGCMVNGAGLAMATMDIIKYYGGEPANFLDVGGGTSVERVREAFKILLSDTNVKGVFVNIFGGIVRTDLVATGITAALKEQALKIPVVVRLIGTNEEEGRRIIATSGMNCTMENDLAAAARLIVEQAKGA